MPEAPKSYSLARTMLFFGNLILEGFGEGNAITAEPTSDRWVAVEGVDGSAAFADTGSEMANISIFLLQTSYNNKLLTSVYERQNKVNGLALPFRWVDAGGLDAISAKAVKIKKMPKIERGNKIATQEWQLLALGAKLSLGGSLHT